MRKRGQYYLRLVSRLCIAFVMTFSIMLWTCVNDVHAMTHLGNISISSKTVRGDTIWSGPSDAGGSMNETNTVTQEFLVGTYTLEDYMTGSCNYLLSISINDSLTISQPANASNKATRRYYVVYNGDKYYFGDNYAQFITRGAYNSIISLYVEFTTTAKSEYSSNGTSYRYVSTYAQPVLNISSGVIGLYQLDETDVVPNSKDVELNNSVQQGNQLQQQENQLQEQNNQLQQQQNETTNNIFKSISNFFGSFFDNLIGIFVPESGYFENYFQRLNNFFAEKLGMLYAPIDMFIGLLNAIKDSNGSDSGIQFPGLKWEDTYIIEPQTISISSIAKDFPGLKDKIYFATDVIMVGAVVWLLQVKLKEVLTT